MRDWDLEEVGLEVPGLGRVRRDEAVKAAALRLLDEGFRRLLREAYDLNPDIPVAQRVRPGFATLGPEIKAAFRDYFNWFQRLQRETNGTLAEAWAEQLGGYRAQYDGLRARVKTVRGGATDAPPGAHLYQPPKPGESWGEWLRQFPGSSGFAFGAVLAIGLLLWLKGKG